MIGAYASAALVAVASLVVGRAIVALAGRDESPLLAAPVGLAAILTLSGIAIHLPGRATTVAILLTLLTIAAVVHAWWRRRTPGAGPTNFRSMDARTVRGTDAERSSGPYPVAAAAGLLALLAASVPFAVNGHIGILGVGLVNDDMASHLAIADWLKTHLGQQPELIGQGYPLGPHALAAALSTGLGAGLIETFAGITLAIPVLAAVTACGALSNLAGVWRVAVSAMVALPYLAVAYLAQEAFKEPIMALLLLGFALLLPATRSPRAAIPLGVIAAGSVYAYSFPGLAWLAGTAAIYTLALFSRRWARGDVGVRTGAASQMSRHHRVVTAWRASRDGHRRLLLATLTALGVLLVLSLPELGRIADFTGFRAFHTSALSGGLGNLRHQLSPLEALGIWPASDFRLSAADASGPAIAFYAGALLALVAFALGLPRWIRRHGWALPSALAAALAIYLGALLFGTVYTSAKALAIASPLFLLTALGGLLDREPRRDLLHKTLAILLIAGATLSSFLVLRQAPVGPDDHRLQLDQLRPLVQGRKVLFLGRDNFVTWELRGARPFVAVRNFYDRNYVKPNLRLEDVFRKFDFDSVPPATLGRFPYVITTRAAYASGPPPGFMSIRMTDDFVLWKRVGPVGDRRTLAEGDRPGATLDCHGPHGRAIAREPGAAVTFARQPAIGGTWSPSATVESGGAATQTLNVPRGRWEVSLQYDATRSITLSAPGLEATLPANLDYRGSVPYYPAGELTTSRRGPVRFAVTVEQPPLVGRMLGTKSIAHLGAIALSPAGPGGPIPGEAERIVPLHGACGGYVDWYSRG